MYILPGQKGKGSYLSQSLKPLHRHIVRIWQNYTTYIQNNKAICILQNNSGTFVKIIMVTHICNYVTTSINYNYTKPGLCSTLFMLQIMMDYFNGIMLGSPPVCRDVWWNDLSPGSAKSIIKASDRLIGQWGDHVRIDTYQ